MSQDIQALRSQIQSLRKELTQTKVELREVNSLLNLSLSLTRRLTGDENLQEGTAFVHRFILALNQLRLAMLALQAASGPIGWAIALLGLAGAGMSYADMIESGMKTR